VLNPIWNLEDSQIYNIISTSIPSSHIWSERKLFLPYVQSRSRPALKEERLSKKRTPKYVTSCIWTFFNTAVVKQVLIPIPRNSKTFFLIFFNIDEKTLGHMRVVCRGQYFVIAVRKTQWPFCFLLQKHMSHALFASTMSPDWDEVSCFVF